MLEVLQVCTLLTSTREIVADGGSRGREFPRPVCASFLAGPPSAKGGGGKVVAGSGKVWRGASSDRTGGCQCRVSGSDPLAPGLK